MHTVIRRHGKRLCLAVVWLVLVATPIEAAKPNVLLISIDTLRADRMSCYGYSRNTSPNLDRLLAEGMRFTRARTVEPLTAPALASMLTSLAPHEHGSTRNGLRVRDDLPSLPRILRRQGYRSAAFVGSWTLRNKLWGMDSHFDRFEDVLTKARWYGLVKREANADDINQRALEWLAELQQEESDRPFFAWVHYVEPHAPYKTQRDFIGQLGPAPDGDLYSAQGRYDSEIAYVDHYAMELVDEVRRLYSSANTLILFVADHGESLGEHGYWGHGRNLYEATLHIPMGIVWPGEIESGTIDSPALITDLAPTVLGLLDLDVPDFFQGFDWTGVMMREEAPLDGRVTTYQAHKGSVSPKEQQVELRQRGLLQVARIVDERKEIVRVGNLKRWEFDLAVDPAEENNLDSPQSEISTALEAWLETVRAGLQVSDELPPPSFTDEDVEALKALGYLE
ncbi:MAG: sulfatase [Acidobacteriota bacterium]